MKRVQGLDALLRREQELRLSAAAQQAVASPLVCSLTVGRSALVSRNAPVRLTGKCRRHPRIAPRSRFVHPAPLSARARCIRDVARPHGAP